MSKKNDDSIEEFFKKGVRKSDITFRESDWQKMERMLDEKAMVGSAGTSRSLKRIIGGAVIIALLSSLYFLIPEHGQDALRSTDKKVVAKDEAGKANNRESDKFSSPSNNSSDELAAKSEDAGRDRSTQQDVEGSKQSESESAKQLSQDSNGSRSANAKADQQKSGLSRRDPATRQEHLRINPATPQSGAIADHVISRKADSEREFPGNTTTNETLSDATTKRSIEKELNSAKMESQQSSSARIKEPTQALAFVHPNESVEKQSTPIQPVQPEAIGSADNVSAVSPNNPANTSSSDSDAGATVTQEDTVRVAPAGGTIVESAAEESKDDHDNDETISPSRWSVALVLAPEFSSTSFDKQTAPGSAYGLTIGYRILNRLTISTGVIKTHKKYVGYGEDYQPPAGYWKFRTNGVVPDEVSGQCSVIEVPVMLQFDVLQREKSRFFTAVGVSSYRMLNEKYAYTFNEPNDGAADGWSTDQPSSYYFSVGHLSLGYDHRLYRGLHVGIEPYVKIPFAGIGWSNVNLLTMGAYLNVRYKFLKRN